MRTTFFKKEWKMTSSRQMNETLIQSEVDLLKWGYVFSYSYIILPIILFLLNWIKLYWAIPLLAFLGLALYKVWKEINLIHQSSPSRDKFKITYMQLLKFLVISFIIFLWVYYSGVGSTGFQNGDFDKHNAMLNDLVKLEWPIAYKFGANPDSSLKLVYYLAFYLPPALLGKMFNYEIATKGLLLWTFIGVMAGFMWFSFFIGRLNYLTTLFFILFSGMDFIGRILTHQKFSQGTEHIEWWSDLWQYSANSSLLYWVPQHTIPGWLITGMVLYEFIKLKNIRNCIFLTSLSALWSPFVMLGIVPLLGASIDLKRAKLRDFLADSLSLQNISGFILLVLIGLYYLGRFPDVYKGWIWDATNIFNAWPKLVIFEMLEFGFYAYFCFSALESEEKEFYRIFKIGIICLVLIPFYKFGMYNDFAMRSSIPSLFILQIGIMKYLNSSSFSSHDVAKKILIVTLVIGFLNGGIEIARALRFQENGPFASRSVVEITPGIAIQYLGKEDSIFFRHLSPNSKAEVEIPAQLRDLTLQFGRLE